MKKLMVLMVAALCWIGITAQASTVLLGPDVNNGSFESPDAGTEGGAFVIGSSLWKTSDSPLVVTQVQGGAFNEVAHHGKQFAVSIAGTGANQGIYQDQDTLGYFAANTVYTLTGYGSWSGFYTDGMTQQDAVVQMRLGTSTAAGSHVSDLPHIDPFNFTAFPTLTIDTSVETGLVGSPIVVMLYTNGVELYPRLDNIVLTATAVPEPMTLGLLTLGGLLLRRKA